MTAIVLGALFIGILTLVGVALAREAGRNRD
jgi:hypothetical protein